MFFARRKKAVKSELIFAHVRVNQEGDFGVEIAKGGVSRERDLHDVADTGHVHQDLVGALVGEATTKLADHRWSVLPRCRSESNRLSHQHGGT